MDKRYYDFATYMSFLMDTYVPVEFQPCNYYNKDGDQFEIYWKNEDSYAKDIKGNGKTLFALHYSMDTDEVIGITIYGIKTTLKKESMLVNEPDKVKREIAFSEWLLKQESNTNER